MFLHITVTLRFPLWDAVEEPRNKERRMMRAKRVGFTVRMSKYVQSWIATCLSRVAADEAIGVMSLEFGAGGSSCAGVWPTEKTKGSSERGLEAADDNSDELDSVRRG